MKESELREKEGTQPTIRKANLKSFRGCERGIFPVLLPPSNYGHFVSIGMKGDCVPRY